MPYEHNLNEVSYGSLHIYLVYTVKSNFDHNLFRINDVYVRPGVRFYGFL